MSQRENFALVHNATRGKGPRTKRARLRIVARRDAEARVQHLADFERRKPVPPQGPTHDPAA